MKTMRGNNGNNKHPMARAPRNLNYLNQKLCRLVKPTMKNNLESTIKTMRGNNESNKTSYGASAKKSKLSKPKTRSMVDKEDNINNYSYLAFARMIITASPTLLSGEGIYLSTMETIIFNNKNNFDSTMKTI